MKELEKKILEDGRVFPGEVLKVDNFINHQVDTAFMDSLGKEFGRLFKDEGINKLLTIEASGIAIAMACAPYFAYSPVVFAKKGSVSNMSKDFYCSKVHSYTHNQDFDIRVSKNYLTKDDVVLIVDDFLANGEALNGLLDVCAQAGCKVAGCGIVIEKAYQKGGKLIRDKGVRVESLARVSSMSDDGKITFCD